MTKLDLNDWMAGNTKCSKHLKANTPFVSKMCLLKQLSLSLLFHSVLECFVISSVFLSGLTDLEATS